MIVKQDVLFSENGYPTLTPKVLEKVYRHYFEFCELYKFESVEEIELRGVKLNVHDLLPALNILTSRQKEAIYYTCIYNLNEVDVAKVMYDKDQFTAAVGNHKRIALQKLVEHFVEDFS